MRRYPSARSCGRLVATKERKRVPTTCVCYAFALSSFMAFSSAILFFDDFIHLGSLLAKEALRQPNSSSSFLSLRLAET